MSREIKFRAWDLVLGYYAEAFVISCGDVFRTCRDFEDGIKWKVDLEEYTGLKDKNGVEIYEGDGVILRYDSGRNYGRGFVSYKCGAFFINDMPLVDGYSECLIMEVVCNIHENPELLERSQN